MSRISPGTMTAAIFAILVGLAGAYAVRQYLQDHDAVQAAAPQEADPQTVYVPVAAQDLMVGQTLTINDILIRKYTPQQFSKSPYADKAFMPNSQQIAGRTLSVPVQKGEVFDPTSFFPDGMGPGIAEMLKEGYRAVTVPIKNVGAVEGFAQPGSMVDVLFRSESTENEPVVTVTLLERVQVLALGQAMLPNQRVELGDETSEKGTVTLAVTPAQAKALKVVEGRGELSLALRHPNDTAALTSVVHSQGGLTLEELLGRPETKRTQMEIYRGGKKETLEFSNRGGGSSDQQIADLLQTPVAAGAPANVGQAANGAETIRPQQDSGS